MAADHLFVDAGDYVRDVEAPRFPADVGVEEDLEEQVSEFFGYFLWVAMFERIEDFVRFFDQVGFECVVGLLAVPWTSSRGAEAGLEGD